MQLHKKKFSEHYLNIKVIQEVLKLVNILIMTQTNKFKIYKVKIKKEDIQIHKNSKKLHQYFLKNNLNLINKIYKNF